MSDGTKGTGGGEGGEVAVSGDTVGCGKVDCFGGLWGRLVVVDFDEDGFGTFGFIWELVWVVAFTAGCSILDAGAIGSLGGRIILTGAFLGGGAGDGLRGTEFA